MAAKCKFCNQDMKPGTGCTLKEYTDMGPKVYARVPYNGEGHCHDCAVATGQLHHPGCDMERCPKCNGQALSCGCTDKPEEDKE